MVVSFFALFVCQFVRFDGWLFVGLSVFLSVCLFVCLFACSDGCFFVCLSTCLSGCFEQEPASLFVFILSLNADSVRR